MARASGAIAGEASPPLEILMPNLRAVLLRTSLAGGVTLALGATLVIAADPGPHGAAKPEAQMAALDKLLGGRDPLKPPPNVDGEVWLASIPKDNPINAERIALGRKLYFETALSLDGTVACATCHDVSRSFT